MLAHSALQCFREAKATSAAGSTCLRREEERQGAEALGVSQSPGDPAAGRKEKCLLGRYEPGSPRTGGFCWETLADSAPVSSAMPPSRRRARPFPERGDRRGPGAGGAAPRRDEPAPGSPSSAPAPRGFSPGAVPVSARCEAAGAVPGGAAPPAPSSRCPAPPSPRLGALGAPRPAVPPAGNLAAFAEKEKTKNKTKRTGKRREELAWPAARRSRRRHGVWSFIYLADTASCYLPGAGRPPAAFAPDRKGQGRRTGRRNWSCEESY